MKIQAIILAALAFALPAASQDSTTLSLSIDKCREMALIHNSGAVNASLDIIAARYQKQEAAAEYLPTVKFSSFGFYALDPMLKIELKDIMDDNELTRTYAQMLGIKSSYNALQSGYGAAVSVVQPVYAGGRIVTGNRLAALGVEAAQLRKRVQNRKTGEETDGYYWQTVTLEEKLRTLERFRELLDTLCSDAASAYASGLMTEDELLQARLKRNELRTEEIKLRNGIRLSRMNLFDAIGLQYCTVRGAASESRPHIDSVILEDGLQEPQPPEALYADEETIAAALEETRLLALGVESKRMEKRMELGAALPQLAVGASYGYSDIFGGGEFNGAAFATLQIPLSDWWKTSRKLKRLQTQIDKAENERTRLDSQILLMVRKCRLDLDSAWDEYTLALDSEDTARRSFLNTRSHYEAGLVPLSDLLQAQASLRQASDGVSEALSAYRKAARIWQDISSPAASGDL